MAMPIAREIVSAGDQALAILRGLGRRDGKKFALSMIYRSWTEKGVLPGKIFTMCIPKQRFAGLFRYAARKSCQDQLILDAYRRYVATEGVFFRPRPLLSYIKRKSCHGRVPGNALGEYFATVDTRRTHHGEILSPPKRGERITVKFCPRRTLRSMPW